MVFSMASRKKISSRSIRLIERKTSWGRFIIHAILVGCVVMCYLAFHIEVLTADPLPLIPASFDYENAQCLEVGSVDERKRVVPSQESEECLLHIEPEEYIRDIVDKLVGSPDEGACNFNNGCQPPHKPYVERDRRFGMDWPPHGFTMTGKERMKNLRAAIMEVNRYGIQGGIAEFGVWRGGAMIMAAAVMKNHQQPPLKRDLFLFDAFASFGKYGPNEDFLAVSLEDVQRNMELFGFGGETNDHNIHYVKGLFSDTTKQWLNRDDPIAVLRVDGNFYESYQDVLYAMYENVPLGGIVIFDDVFHHSHKSVMQCWMDFKNSQGLPEDLVQIDGSSAWFRKRKTIKIDQFKKKVIAKLSLN
mmetsp:Transcript_15263/g.18080  ORF Transcript_15263/g.18080 Transcript_15263/m.18080 type:complete len:360 (-) Transcript_15263:138-1217(-)